MEKVQETVNFIEKQRAQVHFDLADTKAVLALENQIKQTGTPLTNYHTSWKKMRDREMAIKIAKKPEVFYIIFQFPNECHKIFSFRMTRNPAFQ